jgi:hypothetical protein
MFRSMLVLGSAATLILSLVAARPAAPVAGPGAVIEMQTRFLAALDSGDAKALADFVAEGDQPTSLLMVDLAGRNARADGIDATRTELAKLAQERKEKGGTFASKLLKSQADCSSEHLTYGIFEYETTHTAGDKLTSRRFAATVLAYWTKPGMKVRRMHVSELPDEPKVATR